MTWLDSELERLLAADYLDGIESRPMEEIRAMRAESQAAETAVSFLRRLAQGRLDILHAFIDRRHDGVDTDLDIVVQDLPDIIGSGPARPPGPGRLPAQMAPDMDAGDLTAELDAILDPGRIADLSTLSEADLTALAEELSALEQRVSGQRRQLHERIDRLQAEIVARYKTGQASVDGLLT